MKRCIICGNVDDDNSTVCSACGNHYAAMTEENGKLPEAGTKQSDPEQTPGQATPEQGDSKRAEAVSGRTVPDGGAGNPSRSGTGSRPPRRVKSGPQIYGQEESMQGFPEYADQGTIRRTVQGRPAGRPQQGGGRTGSPQQGRPVRQAPDGQGRPAQTAQRRQSTQAQAGTEHPGVRDLRSRRIQEVSRRALRSPLFTLVTVLFTVYLLSSLLAIVMKELNYSQVVRLLGDTSMPQQVTGYFNTMAALLRRLDSGEAIIADILVRVPDILFCIGLWLIVITVRTAREKMSGIGFGLTKLVIILRLIGACVMMLLLLVISVAIVVAAWVAGEQTMIAMAAVVLVITIVIVMMVIMYYFSFLATLKACRMNSNTGESYGKLSAYVAVLHIILALSAVVTLLSGIVNMEITGIIGALSRMGWMILLGVWIFRYRSRMSEVDR